MKIISQEDQIGETNSALKMPLGMWNQRITPFIPGINILPVLKVRVAMDEL